MIENQHKQPKTDFRFLSHEEFAALAQQERIDYLARALQAIKDGVPLEALPVKPDLTT